jgi:putative transcriptional regulator
VSEEEVARMAIGAPIQRIRRRTGLSQAQFAAQYRINLARLRDLEQGRTHPDSALLAYLTVIDKEPELVRRALAQETAAA